MNEILNFVRRSRHNHADLGDIGWELELRADLLLPMIDLLRHQGMLTGAARERLPPDEQWKQEYTTADGIGIVSIPE